MYRDWRLNLKVIAMIVRRENWNNPKLFKAVIIIGIVMTSLGLFNWLFGVGHPQTWHSWGEPCYILMIYQAGQITKLSHVLRMSARLKQNSETCVKTTSGFKHSGRTVRCDEAEHGFTATLNGIVRTVLHRILGLWSLSGAKGGTRIAREGSSRVIALWQHHKI